jgi:DNA-binding CsgD family transcriptional regulator
MSKRTLDEAGLVSILEAAYAIELSDEAWLQGVLHALAAVCGSQHHYLGFFYDASDVNDLKIHNPFGIHLTPEATAGFAHFQTLTAPGFVRLTFRSLLTGSCRKTGFQYLEPMLLERERLGWGDVFNINGLDISGLGCNLTLGCREREFSPRPHDARIFRRIAVHVAAAYRCRRRLAEGNAPTPSGAARLTSGAEAVLDEQGRIVHAEGAAAGQKARERIRSAAAAIDSLRSKARRQRGADAIEAWHPLTGARWTLLESFEENGRRYMVARENQSQLEPFAMLTDRERQVVVHAGLGMSTRQIAYSLGISEATVRVLMSRAAIRMGVRTRKELLDHAAFREVRAPSASD